MPRALPPAAGMKAEGECIRQSWALQPGVPCGIIKGMGRRNLVYRAMACLMYAAVALLTIEIFFALLSGRAFLWPEWALIALLMPLLVLSANALLLGALQSAAARAQVSRRSLWLLFWLYSCLLLYLLFLSRSGSFLSDWETYWNYSMVNLVPFRTVLRYVNALRRGVIPMVALANLAGNLLLFAPLGALMPLLFPALRRFWRFLALLLAVLLAVEAIQMALRCGSCDVDDVLLNLIGATTAYFAIRIPPVARWLRRRYYLWESGMAARAGAAAIHQ